jgi:RNA polymerase sigma-70 factor (ECF subfamily)
MTLESFTSDVLPLKDKLYRYAKSILNNEELAQDAVQETMLKIWEKRSDADAIKNLEAWCMTVVRNFALSKYRLKDNQNTTLESGMEIAETSDSPYKKLERSDVINQIDNIVSKLPFKLKEVFQLRDIEGYTYFEICEITGYQLSDVKVSVYRARKTIRENLIKIYAYEQYG